MSTDAIKTELKLLIEREGDMGILKAIKTLLLKTTLDTDLKIKLTGRALRAETDIKEGRVLSKSEFIRQSDKALKK